MLLDEASNDHFPSTLFGNRRDPLVTPFSIGLDRTMYPATVLVTGHVPYPALELPPVRKGLH
jgi:hypothetical protein